MRLSQDTLNLLVSCLPYSRTWTIGVCLFTSIDTDHPTLVWDVVAFDEVGSRKDHNGMSLQSPRVALSAIKSNIIPYQRAPTGHRRPHRCLLLPEEPCFCPRRPSMARPQRTAPPPHVVAQARAASQGGLKPPQKTGRRVTFAQAPSRAIARPPIALHLPLIFRLRADRCISLGESGAGHELGCTPGCGTCAPQKRRVMCLR